MPAAINAEINPCKHQSPAGLIPRFPQGHGSLQAQANKVSSNGYEIDSYFYVKDSLLHGRYLCYNVYNRYGHMKECEL